MINLYNKSFCSQYLNSQKKPLHQINKTYKVISIFISLTLIPYSGNLFISYNFISLIYIYIYVYKLDLNKFNILFYILIIYFFLYVNIKKIKQYNYINFNIPRSFSFLLNGYNIKSIIVQYKCYQMPVFFARMLAIMCIYVLSIKILLADIEYEYIINIFNKLAKKLTFTQNLLCMNSLTSHFIERIFLHFYILYLSKKIKYNQGMLKGNEIVYKIIKKYIIYIFQDIKYIAYTLWNRVLDLETFYS